MPNLSQNLTDWSKPVQTYRQLMVLVVLYDPDPGGGRVSFTNEFVNLQFCHLFHICGHMHIYIMELLFGS